MKTIQSSQPFQDPAGNALVNGNLILELSQGCEVTSGGGQVVPKLIVCPLDGTGKLIAKSVWFNDELTPSGTYYRATASESGGTSYLLGNWVLSGASPLDVSTEIPISSSGGTVSYPNPVLLAPSADQKITGAFNLTSGKFNSVVWVDGTQYTTLAGAYAALPSGGGTVMVPPNYTETLTGNLALSKNNAGFIFTGSATITMGTNQVTMTAGVTGAFIIGQIPGNAVSTALTFSYTGSGVAFDLGSTSVSSSDLWLENIQVAVGSSATVSVHIGNTTDCYVNGLILTSGAGSSNTQIGLKLDGNTLTDGVFINVQAFTSQTGILCTGQANVCVFINSGANNSGVTGGIGMDFEGSFGQSCVLLGCVIEFCATALKYGGSTGCNRAYGTFSEGCTTDVSFGASTIGNVIDFAFASGSGGIPIVSDSGTSNSVPWARHYKVDASGNLSLSGTVTLSGSSSGSTVVQASATASGTLTLPAATDTLVGKATADTLTNKTLTSPVISSISNTGTLTLPTSTDTLVGRATTDTLSNKTLTGTSSANSVTLLNYQGSAGAITGTGADATIYTFSIPGNTMAAGKGVRIKYAFSHSSGTASPTYKISYGGTAFSIASGAQASGVTVGEFVIFNNSGVTNAQVLTFYGQINGGTITGGPNTQTYAKDSTTSQAAAITFNVAATDQVTPLSWIVELLQ